MLLLLMPWLSFYALVLWILPLSLFSQNTCFKVKDINNAHVFYLERKHLSKIVQTQCYTRVLIEKIAVKINFAQLERKKDEINAKAESK